MAVSLGRAALSNIPSINHTISTKLRSPRPSVCQQAQHVSGSRHVRDGGATASTTSPTEQPSQFEHPRAWQVLLPAAALCVGHLLDCPAASALEIHTEPANALSLPTWAIHVSSTVEWVVAMLLMWRYAEVTGNPRWKGMSWGMLPLFGSAMCACTWHFFYNSTELEFLVVLQAALTVVGNFTCWYAAYRIYQGAQESGSPNTPGSSS